MKGRATKLLNNLINSQGKSYQMLQTELSNTSSISRPHDAKPQDTGPQEDFVGATTLESPSSLSGQYQPLPGISSNPDTYSTSRGTQLLAIEPGSTLPLDHNPAAIYLASLRPVGRRGMQRALAAMVETIKGAPADPLSFPWHNLRFQHTQALRAKLAERYRPSTVNHMLSALRGVLSQAENLGLISADDFRRTTKIKGIRGETLPKGRALAGEELKLLLKCCQKDTTLKGFRDVALVAVLYGAGLRRSEVVKLDLKDFDPKDNSIKVRSGKGGKDRLTYLGQGAGGVVSEWVSARGVEPGPLFLPVNKAGKLMKRRLSDQAVLWILEQRGKEAGLEHFSPHDMRRTFISDLLYAGADIATVQKLAGHASVQTTARYDRRGVATKQKAAELLNLPFSKEE
jgi:site-specific recombinase XerD